MQHRVNEIRALVPSDCWQHCPGTDNPADLPSRGLTPIDLALSDLWTKGPRWLGEPAEDELIQEIPMPMECAVELRVKERSAATNLLVIQDGPGLRQIFNCQNCSSIERLLRVTAHVLRFVDNLKRRSKTCSTGKDATTSEPQNLARAEVLWIKATQEELARDGSFERLRKQFDLFLGGKVVWRCGGRLSNADVPFHVKYPILLRVEHPIEYATMG